MASVIACPKCLSRLKIGRMPANPAKIQCPHCSHIFTIGPSVKAGPPPVTSSKPRPETDEPERSRVNPALVWGIGGGVLAVVGLVAALIFFNSGDATPETGRDDPARIAKGKPPVVDTAAEEKARQDMLAKEQQAERDRLAQEEAAKEEAAREAAAREQAAREKAEKVRIEKDKAAKAVAEQKTADFLALMRRADKAATARNFDEAITAYEEALKIFPDNKDAAQQLEAARTERANLARNQNDLEKRKQELGKLLAQADDALMKKQWADARQLYKLVLELSPADKQALKGFKDADTALEKDKGEKDKLARFEAHMTAGKAALKASKLADAVREFTAAQLLFPFDPAPAQLVQQAENKMLANKDEDKRKADYKNLMDQAGAASRNQDYPESQRLYEQALKLFPKDAAAANALANVQNALRQVQAQFNLQMAQGQAALNAERFAEAVQIFNDLYRQHPRNPQVLAALRNAEQLMALSQTYDTAMFRGNAFLRKKIYRDAAIEFEKALSVRPKDRFAADGLQTARAGLQAESRNLKDYERLVNDGSRDLKARKFAEAAKSFRAATKLMPSHESTPVVAKQARYAEAMDKGFKALAAKLAGDAVRHFQEALFEYPNDQLARDGLAEAQRGENRNAQDFERFAKDGLQQVKLQQWTKASQSLQAALKAMPTHNDAPLVARYARYADAMDKGQIAMNTRNFKEAVRLYQMALLEIPNDFVAQTQLTRARAQGGGKK